MTVTADDIKAREKALWKALEEVKDPEIPIVSVVDLGMITKVEVREDGHAIVNMTPTFTGCPALDVIQDNLKAAVKQAGFSSYEVNVDYDVTWDSNRITEKGKQQLEKFGLGSPKPHTGEVELSMVEDATCPFCGSDATSLQSPFGSALCRSIHYCHKCQQTFERFKPV